ncbi:Retrovirus-related Pol poly from transposon TNT 1-94 [Paramuricea clavata]|uniref:Retrovirus-related Pol poly from transposon TNT 1-94 n=1 Tax=Paramuricea clavata TaxID=317549 RepID=A0A7D9IJR2_PARCT|nr:Retrovirus-related Pol poly from transposon TNT 1-94 [Paramuricea clavata]
MMGIKVSLMRVLTTNIKLTPTAAKSRRTDSSSDSDEVGLMVNHAFSSVNGRTNTWIIDSGATCHMCNDASQFVKLHNLEKPEDVTLADGHVVKATGRGVVKTKIESPNGQKGKSCVLQDVLYVPSLSNNLVSVSKATKSGKTEDYDKSKDIDFCESCAERKHHRSKFPVNESQRAKMPLDLVHSDVCGKMSAKSLSGTEYFLTFIDDHTHYVWIYVLKHKDEVFGKFLEWKALVEKSSGRKDERKKLDSKARKCILLGYGTETKGYRLYDANRARVFHSRDVQFNESSQEPEVVKVQEPKQNTLVELEFEEPIDAEEPVVKKSLSLKSYEEVRKRSKTTCLLWRVGNSCKS